MTDTAENELPWIATLVHGERYELRGKVFERGSDVPVSETERQHLEEHAVDVVLTPGFDPDYDHEDEKTSHRAKFEFRDNDGATNAIEPDTAGRSPPPTRRGIVSQGRRAVSRGGEERA